MGQIDIRVIPETFYNSAEHLPMLKELLDFIRPIGVKINLLEPEHQSINLTGRITVIEGANGEKAQADMIEFISNYISGLSVGEDLNAALIIADVAKGAVENVLDIYDVTTIPKKNEKGKVVVPEGFLPRPDKITIIYN
jgi:hypothetical protein